MRFKKICYDESSLHEKYEKLLSTFVPRGWNKNNITQQIQALDNPTK